MNGKDQHGLYDASIEKSSCGVGFITRKDSKQTHQLIRMGNEALCSVPHRGGVSSEGVGDGAGISIDLSLDFFESIVGKSLSPGKFGVGNFFMPNSISQHQNAKDIVTEILAKHEFNVLAVRDIPVNNSVLRASAVDYQLPIVQWIFEQTNLSPKREIEQEAYEALLEIEKRAYLEAEFDGLYPLSLSSKMQVLKGRLSSNEIIPYFADLSEPNHCINTLFFHTRFSTNTDPHPSMAQPFRMIAHNGELNTDKKNRLSENAIARSKSNQIVRPKGQSDSCRLDQTFHSRIIEDEMDMVTAVVSMMPPAWENDDELNSDVRDMLEYFSLYEEKNDGPAALIFGDGNIIGARLDRLGLRPLRSIETDNHIAVTSEAGQINFVNETTISRGRIEAGGMLYYDHSKGEVVRTKDALLRLSRKRDYSELLKSARINLSDINVSGKNNETHTLYSGDLTLAGRYVAYSHNQESFKFMIDPMLETGIEKVSAMGYGNAINALSDNEGSFAKYFSQMFAQVTNPPLDSIRESDGMTLRVALGAKPANTNVSTKQIVVDSPILSFEKFSLIKNQEKVPVSVFSILFDPVFDDIDKNANQLKCAIDSVCDEVEKFSRDIGGIVILSDREVSRQHACIPLILMVSAVNQRLIEAGLRFKVSVIVESGQISSSHHIACVLGFGASAVCPMSIHMRAEEKFGSNSHKAFEKFSYAASKALMKTMGKVGLCTVESYCGGEFFEPNFLDTKDDVFSTYFPNMYSPCGGVGFSQVAQTAADWHFKASDCEVADDIPILGLFKERSEGAGHSYGVSAVRGFVDLTEEPLRIDKESDHELNDQFRLLTLNRMESAFGISDEGYINSSFDYVSKDKIDKFKITPGYRKFTQMMTEERTRRPAALRDVLAFPIDVTSINSANAFRQSMMLFNRRGNNNFLVRGVKCKKLLNGNYELDLSDKRDADDKRLVELEKSFIDRFGVEIVMSDIHSNKLWMEAVGNAASYLDRLLSAPDKICLEQVQPASEITSTLSSGAMSHGALVASAHEAVAHGINMVGGMSNCGEGGEHFTRYGTIRASKIKQFASGRFGVWAGYLADPMIEEVEIKIGQGAKPGEGGQLPAQKVNVEIAAARGGIPGVELISPPPHHDTYSIEDLAQLIHDAKAARVRVIVKLVSSHGIGTIAVGVAKAGADIINVAGNTGGTGAASVTSLKYTGRAAEIGIAEVHQALLINGLREKVILRCSGAHQTGSDVVKSALLGADSFEFGTTALMMLKCVMAKNCNVKCPAGLTTNPEVFDGDPRALGQYFLNVAHEVREILADLGIKSLREARGKVDLLHLLDHPASVGQLDVRAMLANVKEHIVDKPIYLKSNYYLDDKFIRKIKKSIFEENSLQVKISHADALTNCNKSVGGQVAVDIERMLNYEYKEKLIPGAYVDARGRKFLHSNAINIKTFGAAGQSYGLLCNDGMMLEHEGTCNDGVGKGACGGTIVIKSPKSHGIIKKNVLVGNFALFGATGGRMFFQGEAGDRFAVRNSGASAVVEGVGEFCAEYMTNGTIMNLGGFSKGMGNGMSGGFVYQFDPNKSCRKNMSHESVDLAYLEDDTLTSEIHSIAIETMLHLHIQATGSSKAYEIISNWDAQKRFFAVLTPKALKQYQDSNEILAEKTQKELIEELSVSLVGYQINKLKKCWRSGTLILDGHAPDSSLRRDHDHQLLNSYFVLDFAQKISQKKYPSQMKNTDLINKVTRNLILTEDHSLMNGLLKFAKKAIMDYSSEQLAVLIADKRLRDFKQALNLRNCLSMDSIGTYSWILQQDRKNQAQLGEIPDFEELFSKSIITDTLLSTG